MPDAPHAAAVLPEDLPEGADSSLLDVLVRERRRIAATAWAGYRGYGRGIVVLEGDPAAPGVSCRPSVPSECAVAALDGYDLDQEALVAVMAWDEVVFAARIGSWPPPPAGWTAPAAPVAGEALQ